jgi:20S proteasome subunit beta 7
MVTGASVLAIKYKDGIMMASDTLASYGSMARFRNIQRLHAIGTHTIVGMSGELSDAQTLLHDLEDLVKDDFIHDDGQKRSSKEIWNYLTRKLYNQRNKFDPFWNQLVVGGVSQEGPFLGYVDLHGSSYEDATLATGYGAHLARPIMRNRAQKRMADNNSSLLTEEEAKQLLEDCMRVLFYRDARTINKIQLGKITAAGVEITPPYSLVTDWSAGFKVGETVVNATNL